MVQFYCVIMGIVTAKEVIKSMPIIQVGPHLICHDTVPMFIPSGGNHVRQVNIFLPVLFAGEPTVLATFRNDAPGEPFAVYGIDVVPHVASHKTQIKISAAQTQNHHETFDVKCDYVVLGIEARQGATEVLPDFDK